jgi:hypothetical protein
LDQRIYFYYNVTTAPVRADTLIKKILKTTSARLIVSSIPPVYSSITNTRIVTFNHALDSIVNVYRSRGHNISFVDNYSGMDRIYDLLTDYVHPNSSGNRKIADVFYNSINSYYNAIEKKLDKSSVPNNFKLYQNYPNPFNSDTNIRYQVTSSVHVNLKVYNILGEEIMTCVSGIHSPGEYTYNLHCGELSSGIYIYKLLAENFTGIRQLCY